MPEDHSGGLGRRSKVRRIGNGQHWIPAIGQMLYMRGYALSGATESRVSEGGELPDNHQICEIAASKDSIIARAPSRKISQKYEVDQIPDGFSLAGDRMITCSLCSSCV